MLLDDVRVVCGPNCSDTPMANGVILDSMLGPVNLGLILLAVGALSAFSETERYRQHGVR